MKTLLLVLVALAGGLLPLQVRAVVMELRGQQTLTGTNLTLNDLLDSSQGLTADDLHAVIAPSPSLGNSETWTRAQIESALPASLRAQPIEWQGAAACLVERPAVQCHEQDVRQMIIAELANHLPPNSDFALLELPGLQPFPVPDGDLETRVELTPGSLRNEWGEATLFFSVEGELAVTKSVRFHWAYSRLVWQAVASLRGGDPLTSTDFQQVKVNVLQIPGLLQPTTDFPEGNVAAHPFSAGKILMDNDWVAPVLVARDDLVTILYDHHGVSITVQARAMASGKRNEVIAVQNLTSHKIFNARVVDERKLVYDE